MPMIEHRLTDRALPLHEVREACGSPKKTLFVPLGGTLVWFVPNSDLQEVPGGFKVTGAVGTQPATYATDKHGTNAVLSILNPDVPREIKGWTPADALAV